MLLNALTLIMLFYVISIRVFHWGMFIVRHGRNKHDDVIKWKHFPRYWPFERGIHRWIPHKGQWHGALMFSLICARTNGLVNNRDAGDLTHHHTHYDVTVTMKHVEFINNYINQFYISRYSTITHWKWKSLIIIVKIVNILQHCRTYREDTIAMDRNKTILVSPTE